MRRLSCLHSLGLGLTFFSFAALPACQSSSADDPPAFVNPSPSAAGDDGLLASLEINPAEEPIADEQGGPGIAEDGTLASDSEPDPKLDEFNEAIIDTPPEQLADNPVFDDEEEVADITTLSLSPLVTPGQLPGSDQASALVHGPWKCVLAGNVVPGCSCKGSPRNCYVPNVQPGRNRYLPPAFAAEIPARLAATKAAVDAANAAAAAATPPGMKQAAPKAPVDGGKFHIAPGTVVYDGNGIARGALSPPGLLPRGPNKPTNVCITWADATTTALTTADGVCVKINFGAKKQLQPAGLAKATYVYAFNVLLPAQTPPDPTGLDASGWVALSAIQPPDQDTLIHMHTASNRRVTAASSFAKTSFVVKSAQDWGSDPAHFTEAALPLYAQAKVSPGREANRKVGDYLLKNGNVWNLAYNTPGVGGVGTDTFVVAHDALAFRRVKSTAARPTLLRVKVYDNAARKTEVFAYGEVAGRFGWVALDAIKIGAVDQHAPTTGVFADKCAQKADGTYCDEVAPSLGHVCRSHQIAGALQCPAPYTICSGPSPDGTSLICHD
ncbi:MAG: hypothetical protein QOI41_6305 [Myxococcales bacterium]|nr:hypothetical protein [Myxococcales bacterium]